MNPALGTPVIYLSNLRRIGATCIDRKTEPTEVNTISSGDVKLKGGRSSWTKRDGISGKRRWTASVYGRGWSNVDQRCTQCPLAQAEWATPEMHGKGRNQEVEVTANRSR